LTKNGWGNVEDIGQGKTNVPTLETPNLDAFNLRVDELTKLLVLPSEEFQRHFHDSKTSGELIGGIKTPKQTQNVKVRLAKSPRSSIPQPKVGPSRTGEELRWVTRQINHQPERV